MKNYKTPTMHNTRIQVNTSIEGQTLEDKVERLMNNKEPIKEQSPLLYTERKEGVRASTNIRTDRFEVAIEAHDRIQKSYSAKREERAKMRVNKDGEAESIQGKGETPTGTNAK